MTGAAQNDSAIDGTDARRGDPFRRIAVVDDDTVLREGIGALLPDVHVVVAARSLDEFLTLSRTPADVDVLVLDLNLRDDRPGAHVQGRRAVKAAADAGYRVLIYTNEQRRAVLAGCYLSGARGIAHKTEPLRSLRSAIEAVAEDRVVVTAAVAGLLDTIARAGHLPWLTDRQAAVLNGRARGETYAAIGRRLGISDRTAEEYMADVLRKVSPIADGARTPGELERLLGLGPGDLMA